MGLSSLGLLRCLTYLLAAYTRTTEGGVSLEVPARHRALSGDLEVHIRGLAVGRLELEESVSSTWRSVASLPLPPPPAPRQLRFPCGLVTHGGRYRVRLKTTQSTLPDEDAVVELEVLWPMASVSLSPSQVATYPEEQVTGSLSFAATYCQPALGSREPETWLDLLFCGHSPDSCVVSNDSHTQLMYSEQVRGFPRLLEVPLKCELFGLAGYYALALRPRFLSAANPIAVTPPSEALKAVWSDKFVFNVHARSIFPCEEGTQVLFQYPGCILAAGDRVRVFARQRAAAAAAAPPAALRYIAEQRVPKGRHSLRFDCSLFSEKFLEYCFVYVSQAITGAFSDVRMDCVPTLPVLDSESGGWGSWSAWTECSSTCSGGTRNRYRFCDSPPPRYGAAFCQGPALETERCGAAGGGWECGYVADESPEVAAERAEVEEEVGPGCRCGCIVHLGRGRTGRLLAASAHACPGRTFWMVRGDGCRVRLGVERLRLPCASQALRLRDGDSPDADLLAVLAGAPRRLTPVTATGDALVLDFAAGHDQSSDCAGGFLAHALCVPNHNVTPPSMDTVLVGPPEIPWGSGGMVNAGVAFTLMLAVVASACLCLQYVYRYQKYRLTTGYAESDTTENSIGVCGGRSRATSSSTLLSEAISLQKLTRGNKHSRLAEEEEDIALQDSISQLTETIRSIGCKVPPGSHTEVDERASVKLMQVSADIEQRPTSLDVERPKKIHQVRISEKPSLYFRFLTPVSPEGSQLSGKTLTPSPQARRFRQSTSSSQSSTLTNGSSPASSRSTTLKETKDKRNRERMLAGSEFSLAEDLELDYYDYNVQNAEPGSYLSMDPAYCLWIPPFAPGVWPDNDEDDLPEVKLPPSPELEKEIAEEKTPTEYYDLKGISDEIRYVDDDDDMEETEMKAKEIIVTDVSQGKMYYQK